MSNRGSIGVGRVVGIPVRVSYSVAVISVVGALGLALRVLPSMDASLDLRTRLIISVTAVAAFLGSILTHELGHALAARRYGVGTSSIRLWILGGVAALDRQAPSPRAEFWIAAAGPLVNAALAVALFGLAKLPLATTTAPALETVGLVLAATNLLLAVSNLVPAAPLDGGRVLTAWLWRRGGDAEAARVTSARCGVVLGIAVIAIGLFEVTRFARVTGWYTLLIGAFLIAAARSEMVGAVIRGRLQKVTAGSMMTRHPRSVHASLTLAQLPSTGSDVTVAHPVTQWDHSPIGYICADQLTRFGPVESHWTTVAEAMTPAAAAPRAWSTESIDTVFRRIGEHRPFFVVHDPRTGIEIGTVTRRQLEPLLALPDAWGRDRRPTDPHRSGTPELVRSPE